MLEFSGIGRGRLHLLDVLQSGEYRLVESLSGDPEGYNWRNVVKVVSNYPPDLRTRIVLVNLADPTLLSANQRLMNFLRLEFDLEPLFFWSSLPRRFLAPWNGKEFLVMKPPRRKEFLVMEFMAVKLMRRRLNKSREVSMGR